jgi:hypothetical protein
MLKPNKELYAYILEYMLRDDETKQLHRESFPSLEAFEFWIALVSDRSRVCRVYVSGATNNRAA